MSKIDTITDLANKGLHLVPWKNRSSQIRKPLWKDWASEALPEISAITNALVEYPAADWAVVPKNGYMVIDLDNKNGKDGIAIIQGWCQDNNVSFDWFKSGCAVTKTYSGTGRHLWFRYTGDLTSCDIANGVEAKHKTESVHIPPSEGYTWEVEFKTIEQLPELPQWFITKWEEASKKKSEVKLYTLDKVSSGGRHDFAVSYAAKLRDMNMSVDEIFITLKTVCKNRFDSPLDDHEYKSIADSFKSYKATDIEALALTGDKDASNVIAFCNRHKVDIQVMEPELEDYHVEPIRNISNKILHPNEIISKWCNTVDYNCPMNQPVYCLGSAIAGIGAIMGRRYRFNGCFANNYVLLLGATSTGKQAPLSVTKKILRELDLTHLIGSSEFASGQGIGEEIANKNELIWIIDELSFLLRGLAHPSAPGYLLSISKMLLQLYSGGSNEGTAKADGSTRIIENPYPNMLAAAQPSTFVECVTKTFIESGFLGRFMCLTGKDDFKGKAFGKFKGNDKDPVIDPDLIKLLRSNVSSWQSQIAIASGASSDCEVAQMKCESSISDGVQKYFDELADRRSEYVRKNLSGVSDVISKNREKLIKLMMIHAFTTNPKNILITDDSLDWAKGVLDIADSTIESSVMKMSENTQEKDVGKVLDFILRGGLKGVTGNEICASIRSIKKKDRDSIIEDLVFANKIIVVKDTSKPGRPKTTLYGRKFAPKKELSNAN